MNLEKIFLITIIAGLIMTLGLNIYAANLSKYDISGDTSAFGKSANKLKGVYDVADDTRQKISDTSTDESDIVNSMYKGGYTSIKNNPFTVASILTNMTEEAAAETGIIDPFITSSLLAMLTILVIFGVIALIFRFFRP